MRNIGYYHSVLNGRIEIKLWSGRFLSFFSFLIKLLYIIHQKTPRTVKKKTEAPQVDVEGLSFPSYFRYSKRAHLCSFFRFFLDSGYRKSVKYKMSDAYPSFCISYSFVPYREKELFFYLYYLFCSIIQITAERGVRYE